MDEQQDYKTKIQRALREPGETSTLPYTSRDIILYHLGIGATTAKDLSLLYESLQDFHVIPTFCVIPTYFSKPLFETSDILPNVNVNKFLHGEQYSEIYQYPIPHHGILTSVTRIVEILDKGNSSTIRHSTTTSDASGVPIFYNERVTVAPGSGGWGGPKQSRLSGAATASNSIPSREPDHIVVEQTSIDQAAIFRLMGDMDALHIDPVQAAARGFEKPVAHGLATYGIVAKHLYQKYGPFQNIKVRFASAVLPGQTLVTRMWKEGQKVIFTMTIKETGKLCITQAAVQLMCLDSKL